MITRTTQETNITNLYNLNDKKTINVDCKMKMLVINSYNEF